MICGWLCYRSFFFLSLMFTVFSGFSFVCFFFLRKWVGGFNFNGFFFSVSLSLSQCVHFSQCVSQCVCVCVLSEEKA